MTSGAMLQSWTPPRPAAGAKAESMTGNAIPLFRRVVVTKNRIYELEPGQTGTPAAEVYGAEIAERLGLMDATVYDMPDGRRVVARPEETA